MNKIINAIATENDIQTSTNDASANIYDFLQPFNYHDFAAAASELCPTDSGKIPGAVPAALTKETLKTEIRSWAAKEVLNSNE